jgi:GNAT superfamily N-acetyltransferase
MKDEIAESNRQLQEAWKLYARFSPEGEAIDRVTLTFANAKQPWFLMNLCALRMPVTDQADLARRAQGALEYFSVQANPWVLTGSEDWFGPNANLALSTVGLVHKTDVMGMVAEQLLPPVRSFPDVELRRISDEQTRRALADLNADSYEVPREWARLAVGSPALWAENLFGTVAYINQEPASGAFALPIDDVLYVAWVATAKAHRRKGLAEMVMRESLAAAKKATGLDRTVLHATADGHPVYLRMGYRDVVRFPLYGPA